MSVVDVCLIGIYSAFMRPEKYLFIGSIPFGLFMNLLMNLHYCLLKDSNKLLFVPHVSLI